MSSKKNCPLCRKASQDQFAPFCSERCAKLDLGNWFSGKYAIETDERPSENVSSEG